MNNLDPPDYEAPQHPVSDTLAASLAEMTKKLAEQIRAKTLAVWDEEARLARLNNECPDNSLNQQLATTSISLIRRMRGIARHPRASRWFGGDRLGVHTDGETIITNLIVDGKILENHIDPKWGSHTLSSGFTISSEPSRIDWRLSRHDEFPSDGTKLNATRRVLCVNYTVEDIATGAHTNYELYKVHPLRTGIGNRAIVYGVGLRSYDIDWPNSMSVPNEIELEILNSYTCGSVSLEKIRHRGYGFRHVSLISSPLKPSTEKRTDDEKYLEPLIIANQALRLLGGKIKK